MGDKPVLLLFAAPGGESDIERAVTRVQWAVGVEMIEKVVEASCCDGVLVATSAEGMIQQLGDLPVIVERDPRCFHFGRQLRDLIVRYRVQRPLYVGAGSTALFGSDELVDLCRRLTEADNLVISNNFWSTDFAGFVPGRAIEQADLPTIDNNLAFLLNRRAGLPEVSLPPSASTLFDVDTPTDLLILALHANAGKRVRACLEPLELETSRVREVMRLLTVDTAEVVVAGRVGSAAWSHLERETACRIRLFSEERGMRASGREERGEVRSLLGFHVERCGAGGLFAALSSLGNAAIIDSRVIFQHLGLRLSAADRFYSDLGRPEMIGDSQCRAFTEAAQEAAIPILLGGHSLVSGGLWALIEAAWQGSATHAEAPTLPAPSS